MQLYDLIMLAVLGVAIFFGYWKGFAWQVASLAAIFVSYLVARNFHEPVANMIGGDPSWNRFLAMFILFVGTSLLIWLGFGFIKTTIERMHLKGFDRQFGAALGAIKGVVICTLITLFGVSLLGDTATRTICTSRSGNYIARMLGEAGNLVPEEIGKYINPYIDKFHTEMQEHQDDMPPGEFGPGQPGLTLPWSSPQMTSSSSAPNERVGMLERLPGGSQTQQPSFNASTGRWEYPASSQNQTSDSGAFQAPPIQVPQQWQEAAREQVQDSAEKSLLDLWRRAMGDGKQDRP
jgi:membrane protein required for colicin V production